MKMINTIIEMFSYSFIMRAMIVGALVSISASLLGVSLVLKKYSMIGEGLSRVGFGSLAVIITLNTLPFFAPINPLIFTIISVVVVAFFLLKTNDNSKISSDSAIALVSSSAFAIGVMFISSVKGINIEINNLLLGSILAMDNSDVILSVIMSIIVFVMFIFFYHKIFAVTFDEKFSRATGIKVDFYNILIAILTALTIVIGMRLIGALLISSLIVFPPITSMRLFKTFKKVVISSALVSVFAFFIGIIISYVYRTPAGASIVVVNLVILIIFSILAKIKGKKGVGNEEY